QVVPRWCTRLRSRGWDRAAFPATLHGAVYSGCPILPHHMTLPAPETLGRTRTCPLQGESAHQIARVLDDEDVPCVYLGEPTGRRPVQRVELQHHPTHTATLT